MKPSLGTFALRAAGLLLLAALALAATACGSGGDESAQGLARVKVGGLEVRAEVPPRDEYHVGLSGRSALPQDRGMLFVFENSGHHAFWMRGMLIPLDIIWISEDFRVLYIQANAPHPPPGAPDSSLELYQPDVDAKYVLEVNAGLTAEKGVQVGDEVEIRLP